jgi:hypothetical protein
MSLALYDTLGEALGSLILIKAETAGPNPYHESSMEFAFASVQLYEMLPIWRRRRRSSRPEKAVDSKRGRTWHRQVAVVGRGTAERLV